jgi:hypothetical protein
MLFSKNTKLGPFPVVRGAEKNTSPHTVTSGASPSGKKLPVDINPIYVRAIAAVWFSPRALQMVIWLFLRILCKAMLLWLEQKLPPLLGFSKICGELTLWLFPRWNMKPRRESSWD